MTPERTIADEMTEAGQAWALTSSEPSASRGDVEEVRAMLVTIERRLNLATEDFNNKGGPKKLFNVATHQVVRARDALSALARVEAELERGERDSLTWMKNYKEAFTAGVDMMKRYDESQEDVIRLMKERTDALHARDRAIDEKHLAVRDLNGVRRERDEARASLDELNEQYSQRSKTAHRLRAERDEARAELAALKEDLRFGDADAQNLAALTEEQARTIDYLHRRLADKEAPEAEDEEPTGAALSGEGDLEGVAKAIRSFGEHGGNAASRAWRFFYSWASTIEAHQCGGEREAEGVDWDKEVYNQRIADLKAENEYLEAERSYHQAQEIQLLEKVEHLEPALSTAQARVEELEANEDVMNDAAASQARRVSELEAEVERWRAATGEAEGLSEYLDNELEKFRVPFKVGAVHEMARDATNGNEALFEAGDSVRIVESGPHPYQCVVEKLDGSGEQVNIHDIPMGAELSTSQARVAELEKFNAERMDWYAGQASETNRLQAEVSELEAEVERLAALRNASDKMHDDLCRQVMQRDAELSRLRSPQGSREAGGLADWKVEDGLKRFRNYVENDEGCECEYSCSCRSEAIRSLEAVEAAVRALGAAPQEDSREKFYENAYKRERKQTKKLTEGLEGLAMADCESGGQCEGAEPADRCPACQAQCVLDWAFPAPQEEPGGAPEPEKCGTCGGDGMVSAPGVKILDHTKEPPEPTMIFPDPDEPCPACTEPAPSAPVRLTEEEDGALRSAEYACQKMASVNYGPGRDNWTRHVAVLESLRHRSTGQGEC